MTYDLNFKTPTKPSYYMNGVPHSWQNETTGRLRAAIMAYLSKTPTDYQLKLVIAYAQHYLHAPCWDDVVAIKGLRAQSMNLETIDQVNHLINLALKVDIDPL